MEVPCTTLREIMESNHLEHVDLLKMDCEGAEYEILYPHRHHTWKELLKSEWSITTWIYTSVTLRV